MTVVNTASRNEWLLARKVLLEKEKQFQKLRDELSVDRRQLPWVEVHENYVFRGPSGELSLADLFDGKTQLIVQHFMMGEDWEEGCPSCSFWADGFNGTTMHFGARDAAFVAVSSAPLDKIEAYKRRLGWNFNWVSSQGSSFNNDFHVSFSQEQINNPPCEYNYQQIPVSMSELPGISVFTKDSNGQIYHTYSCYSRGLDNMNVVYQYLDLLPKGRDEDNLGFTMEWVRRNDQY